MKLRYPVTEGDELIEEISLQRPTVADLMAVEGMANIEEVATLISRCGGLAMPIVKKIDAEDFQALAGELTGFLGKDQPTGKT